MGTSLNTGSAHLAFGKVKLGYAFFLVPDDGIIFAGLKAFPAVKAAFITSFPAWYILERLVAAPEHYIAVSRYQGYYAFRTSLDTEAAAITFFRVYYGNLSMLVYLYSILRADLDTVPKTQAAVRASFVTPYQVIG